MRFEMVGYRVLVQPDPIETETKSGIVIVTDEKLEKAAQQYGTVVDVGKDCWKTSDGIWDPWVEIGDRVLFSKHAGRLLIDPDSATEYMLLNDTDILARVHDHE